MQWLKPNHQLRIPNTEDVAPLPQNSHKLAGNSNNLVFHTTKPEAPITNG